MSKTNHNKTFGTLMFMCVLFITALAMIFGAIGCNSPENRAIHKFNKADGINHTTVLNRCSEIAPPVSSTNDSFIYLQGDPVVYQDTVTVHDTLNNTDTKYITQKIKVTDTVYRVKEVTTVDRAKEYALANELQAEKAQHSKDNTDNATTIAKVKTQRNQYLYAAIAGWAIIVLSVVYRLYVKKYKAAAKVL